MRVDYESEYERMQEQIAKLRSQVEEEHAKAAEWQRCYLSTRNEWLIATKRIQELQLALNNWKMTQPDIKPFDGADVDFYERPGF